jgi:hypothetical protein
MTAKKLPGTGYALLMCALLALAFILNGVESLPARILAYAVVLAPISYLISWLRAGAR